MKRILYVLLGITTGLAFKPIIDKFTNVVLVWLETLSIKPAKKILNHYKDTAILREFINEPEEENEYETYYFEDFD